jgi:DNA-binding transcriptional LysR family regulator
VIVHAVLETGITRLGLACLPRYLVKGEAGLDRLKTPEPAPSRGIWVGVHADTRHTARIRAVREALHEGLSAAASILDPTD